MGKEEDQLQPIFFNLVMDPSHGVQRGKALIIFLSFTKVEYHAMIKRIK